MLLKLEFSGSSLTEGQSWGHVQLRYEACHPEDTFADLVRRSQFSKQDRRLLEDWLAAADVEPVHHG